MEKEHKINGINEEKTDQNAVDVEDKDILNLLNILQSDPEIYKFKQFIINEEVCFLI